MNTPDRNSAAGAAKPLTPGEKARNAINAMPREGGGFSVTEDARQAVKALLASQTGDARLAEFRGIDLERMIALSEQGALDWWIPFTGRVYEGDIDGLRKVYDSAAAASDGNAAKVLDFTSAMTWISRPFNIGNGYTNTIKPEVISQLVEWGADAGFNGRGFLADALRNLDTPSIAALAAGNVNPDTVFTVMAQLHAEGKTQQQKAIEAAVRDKTLRYKLDEQTLVTGRLLPDALGVSSLRTIFNFRAGVVTEVYEHGPARKTVTTGVDMDAYDPEFVAQARESLEALGGTPRMLSRKPAMKLPPG